MALRREENRETEGGARCAVVRERARKKQRGEGLGGDKRWWVAVAGRDAGGRWLDGRATRKKGGARVSLGRR